jgi:hypothetical protein
VADTCTIDGVLHQQEYVRCGKRRCKCNVGVLHGPYWYSYHWVKRKKRRRKLGDPAGRWISRYVGKELPGDRD